MASPPATLDTTLAALADPTRRGVVDLLREKPRRAGDLARAFALTAPAMSRHLRILRKTGLVEEAGLPEDARVRVYRLKPEPFADLREWLEHVEEFWGDQLGAFKAHAERVHGERAERAREGGGGSGREASRGGRRPPVTRS